MDRRRFLLAGSGAAAGLAIGGIPPVSAGHGLNLPYGGVNTHLTYFNTPYADVDFVAGFAKQIEAKLLRDGLAIGQSAGWYDRVYAAFKKVNAVSGAKFVIVSGPADQSVTAQLDVIKPLVDAGIVLAIEGSNEWDLNGGDNWASELRAHQIELYRQVKERWPTMRVLGPTVAPSNSTVVGDLSAHMDIGNIHIYFTTLPIDTYGMNRALRLAKDMNGTRPVVATEMNFIIGDGYTGTEEDQRTGFAETIKLLGERDVHRVMAYELLQPSRPKFASTHRENNFGAAKQKSDGTWVVKPVFFPVREANRRG